MHEAIRLKAIDAQREAANHFMESWRMFTCETLPWAGFDRNLVMRTMQEKSRLMYGSARYWLDADDECDAALRAAGYLLDDGGE